MTLPMSTATVVPSPDEVAHANQRFRAAHPAEVLRWAADRIPHGRLVLSTTFGIGGMTILHLFAEEGIDLPVVFVDTLYHFPETLEHAHRMRDRYGLDLRVVRAAPSREEFEAVHGPRLWERDEELFHALTKVDPMREALRDVDAWITGRRRDQSSSRVALRHVESGPRLKVNPLASWSLATVWEFVRANDLPYNPLHDQGYASIGDAPLTTPIEAGEEERDGRWRGSGRLECGLHRL